MAGIITNADTITFVRSLIGEASEEYWTDTEIDLYIKFGVKAVASKYWYLLAPIDATVEVASLTANVEYVSLPGRAVTTAVFDGSGLNDATFGGDYTYTADLRYVVQIDSTAPDTFKWSKDAGTTWYATGISVATTATTLDNGVTIIFNAATGHTLADEWVSDCVTTDCAKVLRVEVAETRKMLRYIEPDEFWKYSVYDDGAAAASYLNIHYLKNKSTVEDFPEALRPLVALEAVIFALTKDRGIDADILAMHQRFEDNALTFLSTQSMYEPVIFGDYELEMSYTAANPVAWTFRDVRIYLYKYYSEG